MARRYLTLILAATFCLSSCKKEEDKAVNVDTSILTNDLAVYYYKLPFESKYDTYIDCMASCDSTTQEYKNRMKDILKHHTETVRKDRTGIDSIRVERTQYNLKHDAAYVYMNVFYKDKSSEEVLFPLVYVDKKWKIR